MNNRRKFPRVFFLFIFFGIMNLLTLMDSPTWANIRGVDAVRLIGTGMCFGAAIFALVPYIQERRASE